MITKAIISSVIDRYHLKVRIPIYNKAKEASVSTPDDELSTALVLNSPGEKPNYRPGDVVFIGFEENEQSKPVVLGLLFRQEGNSTNVDIETDSLNVDISCKLPEDTTIGDIKFSTNTAKIDNVDNKVKVLNKKVPFKFGVDADGNYGYYKAGADTVTPFSSGWKLITVPQTKKFNYPIDGKYKKVHLFYGVTTSYSRTLSVNGTTVPWATSENVGSNSGWGLSYYTATVDTNAGDYLYLTLNNSSYSSALILDDGSVSVHKSGTESSTATVTLEKNCKTIWLFGGVKSSYYTDCKIDGVAQTIRPNNYGGNSVDGTSGWGLSQSFIQGNFKKGQVLTINKSSTYGLCIVY